MKSYLFTIISLLVIFLALATIVIDPKIALFLLGTVAAAGLLLTAYRLFKLR